MAEIQKTTRISSRARKPGFAAGQRDVYSLPEAGLAEILTGLHLPVDVDVLVAPKSRQAAQRLARSVAVTKIEASRRVTRPRKHAGSGIDAAAFQPSARARALLRGAEIAGADLKAAGGTYELDEVQQLLNNVSRQAILKRVQEGSLLSVPGPNNRRRYPTVQFTRDGLVAGLKEVQAALPTRNPWAVLNFMVQPDDRLDGRAPIDVLRGGEVDLVVSAARSMAVQGG